MEYSLSFYVCIGIMFTSIQITKALGQAQDRYTIHIINNTQKNLYAVLVHEKNKIIEKFYLLKNNPDQTKVITFSKPLGLRAKSLWLLVSTDEIITYDWANLKKIEYVKQKLPQQAGTSCTGNIQVTINNKISRNLGTSDTLRFTVIPENFKCEQSVFQSIKKKGGQAWQSVGKKLKEITGKKSTQTETVETTPSPME